MTQRGSHSEWKVVHSAVGRSMTQARKKIHSRFRQTGEDGSFNESKVEMATQIVC